MTRRPLGLALAAVVLALLAWQVVDRLDRPPDPPQRLSLPPDTGFAHVRAAGVLRIAVDASYPPFAVAAADGGVHGFDVDLGDALAGALHVRPQYVNMGEDGIPDALLAGAVDVAIADMPPDPKRTLGYSLPYYNAGEVLLLRASEQAARGLGDLGGAPIGVELGSAADEWLRGQGIAPPRLRRYDGVAAAATALEQGSVAGVVTDAPTAAELRRHDPGLRIAASPLTVEPYVVATAPQNRSLVAALDAVLLRMGNSGALAALVQRDV